jgi:hypothetical protein
MRTPNNLRGTGISDGSGEPNRLAPPSVTDDSFTMNAAAGQSGPRKPAVLAVTASAVFEAHAADAYRLIADYRKGHPRILPERYFRNMQVEEGGYGAGTIVRFDMLAFGRIQHARSRITEPEPGRVLAEDAAR